MGVYAGHGVSEATCEMIFYVQPMLVLYVQLGSESRPV